MLMNPNSQNQRWSRWTFTVEPARRGLWPMADVTANCARFGRKAFGSASQMRITQIGSTWTIDVRTEGHPVHDVVFVESMTRNWRRFFESGFGVGTMVRCETKLEAGDRQDGTPAEQLIILPPLRVQGARS